MWNFPIEQHDRALSLVLKWTRMVDDRYSIAACSLSLIATPWVKERFRIRKQNVVTWPLGLEKLFFMPRISPCTSMFEDWSISETFMIIVQDAWQAFHVLVLNHCWSHLPIFGNHLHFLSVTWQPWEDRPAFNPVEDSNQSHSNAKAALVSLTAWLHTGHTAYIVQRLEPDAKILAAW